MAAAHTRPAVAGEPPMPIIGAMTRELVHAAFGVLKSCTALDPAMHGA